MRCQDLLPGLVGGDPLPRHGPPLLPQHLVRLPVFGFFAVRESLINEKASGVTAELLYQIGAEQCVNCLGPCGGVHHQAREEDEGARVHLPPLRARVQDAEGCDVCGLVHQEECPVGK